MKNYFFCSIFLMMAAMLFHSTKVFAQEPYAALNEDKTILTFYYDKKKEERMGMGIEVTDHNERGWNIYKEELRKSITTVVFDNSFGLYENLTDASFWFACLENLKEIKGIDNFKTDNVTDMSYMFKDCYALEAVSLKKLCTKSVVNMEYMFYGCIALSSLDLSHFNTENVICMDNMFKYCERLKYLDLSNFNMSKITEFIEPPFLYCSSLKSLNMSNAIFPVSSKELFWSSLEEINLTNCNTEFVTDMSYMFRGNLITTLDLRNFDTRKVRNMEGMFDGCANLQSLNLSNFDTSNVTNMSNMFFFCPSLTELNISSFNTSSVTNMHSMFSNCQALTTIDLSNFNTQNVVDMNSMFDCCVAITSLDVSGFKTSNVADMKLMFHNCRTITSLDLSNFSLENADIQDIFLDCQSMEEINLSGVVFPQNTSGLFFRLSNLRSVNLHNCNTEKVKNMTSMFSGCGIENIDLSSFNTKNVEYMGHMFSNCPNLTTLDLSNFYTENVTNMGWLFDGCSNLKTVFVSEGWSVDNVTNGVHMFTGCYSLIGGEGTAYSDIHIDHTYACIDGGSDSPGYFTYKEPSGITIARMGTIDDEAPVYNLRGQRLTAPQKGVNIIGDKKVVVK